MSQLQYVPTRAFLVLALLAVPRHGSNHAASLICCDPLAEANTSIYSFIGAAAAANRAEVETHGIAEQGNNAQHIHTD